MTRISTHLYARRTLDRAGALALSRADGADIRIPTIGDGVLYSASDGGMIYALDAATGEERWHFARVALRLAGASRRHALFPRQRPHVYAVDAATGKELWRFPHRRADESRNRGRPLAGWSISAPALAVSMPSVGRMMSVQPPLRYGSHSAGQRPRCDVGAGDHRRRRARLTGSPEWRSMRRDNSTS